MKIKLLIAAGLAVVVTATGSIAFATIDPPRKKVSLSPGTSASAPLSTAQETISSSGATARRTAGRTSSSSANSAKREGSRTTLSVPPSKTKKESPSFRKTAFVGNSCIDELRDYGLVKQADYLTRVGLTVSSVYTRPVTGEKKPIMEALSDKKYKKVVLMFGENELGWASMQKFIEAYGKMADDVKQRQPDAALYFHAILPVGKENADQVSNATVQAFNQALKKLAAKKGARFIDPSADLKNEEGYLPTDAAADGIHMNIHYCRIWVDALARALK